MYHSYTKERPRVTNHPFNKVNTKKATQHLHTVPHTDNVFYNETLQMTFTLKFYLRLFTKSMKKNIASI